MMINYKAESTHKIEKDIIENKSENIYLLKQKLCGLTLFIIGILIPLIFNGDATSSIITIPLGVGLMVTKQRVMVF